MLLTTPGLSLSSAIDGKISLLMYILLMIDFGFLLLFPLFYSV